MTEPNDEAVIRIDVVREHERNERDTEISDEIEQTDRIAEVLSRGDSDPEGAPTG